MKTISRSLTYVLGFSVFCACTTTRTMPITDVAPSGSPQELDMTLIDGTRLKLLGATVGPDSIRGEIREEDSQRASAFLEQWQSEDRTGSQVLDGTETRWTRLFVIIPRTDVRGIDRSSSNAVASIGLGLVLALVVLGATWTPPLPIGG